jgi:hypothetical protein
MAPQSPKWTSPEAAFRSRRQHSMQPQRISRLIAKPGSVPGDDDIKRALIEGVRPAHARLPGTPLAAVMPAGFYKALFPSYLDSIVAYLRSVKAARNEIPAPTYKLPVRREPYPDADAGFTADEVRNPVQRGAYLVTIGHRMECHAAWANGVSDYRNGLGKGGRRFGGLVVLGFPPSWEGSIAANITSHPTRVFRRGCAQQVIGPTD